MLRRRPPPHLLPLDRVCAVSGDVLEQQFEPGFGFVPHQDAGEARVPGSDTDFQLLDHEGAFVNPYGVHDLGENQRIDQVSAQLDDFFRHGLLRHRMQGAGSMMQDTGYRIQDSGYRMQDAGCKMQEAVQGIQERNDEC